MKDYMSSNTPEAPVPLRSFKRTKIIATIGPATDSAQAIYNLVSAGANGLRLNFSHGTQDERLAQIAWIRDASQKLGKPVAIIQDLQGPKMRLGDFEGTIAVKAGEVIRLQYQADYKATEIIPTQYDLAQKVKPGERLYIFDGKVRTTITTILDGVISAVVSNDGMLMKRKGMNLPDTDFMGDILTEKDMSDIRFGAKQDIDYVALSFVQSATDIEKLREILVSLGSTAKIIAKVETKAAVDHIEEIVQASDVIMVARGDLAVETLAESVPVVQRQITGLGQKYAKPTIVATQMLLSMVDAPEPTRAEVSDVATAVFTGADCVMLSDETANGKYPVEAVQTMKRVILYAEHNPTLRATYLYGYEQGIQHALSTSVLNMSEKIEAKAIIVETLSGSIPRQIAKLRPTIPILAVTNEVKTAQRLALVYGVKTHVRSPNTDGAMKFADEMLQQNVFKPGDVVVIVSGSLLRVSGTTDTIRVRKL
jgi:pyruvate kinase